jgi:hypothetical protein
MKSAMRISLQAGAFTTALGLLGGGAIVVAPSQLWIGYSLMVAALLLLAWGIKIDDQHWWEGGKALTPEELAYREEMARQKAKHDAKRQRDMEEVQGWLGGNLYVAMEDARKDQQAQAEAQRRRLIREASEPPAPATFGQAFNENVADQMPFVRLRELAPMYGLSLDPHDPASGNVAYKIEGALRQAAVDGELKVWGRRYRDVPDNDPLVPVPAAHFEEYGFAHGNLHYATANSLTRTNTVKMATWGVEGKDGVTYRDLRLSQSGAEAVLRKVKAEDE